MRGASSLFCCILSKNKTKGEILDIIWANNRYTKATIFTKCNVFYARYMAKTWVFTHKLKKNRMWDFRQKLSKYPIWYSENIWQNVTFLWEAHRPFLVVFRQKIEPYHTWTQCNPIIIACNHAVIPTVFFYNPKCNPTVFFCNPECNPTLFFVNPNVILR